MKTKNRGGKGRGPIVSPKEGDTKKMVCGNCLKNRKLQWTWHTWVVPFVGRDYWKCNSCPK